MSTTPLTPIVFNFSVTTAWSTAYTVPDTSSSVGIDAVVFNNYTSNSESFSVRLIQAGVASELNEIITDKNVRKASNDLAPAMVGQSLVKGGRIEVKASANNAINLNITATLVSI